MRGANYPAVTDAVVRRAPIPWPPISEQRRIAEILDQADALRKKRNEADAKADRILPAIFYKMFGDPLSNSRGWDMHELGDLCSAITSGSRGWAIYAGNGDSLFVRTQDVLDGEISSTLLPIDPPSGAEANRTRLQDGDVVITITGVVGKAAVYRDCGRQAYVSQHVALVRTKSSLEPEYLTALANLPAGGASILARLQYGQTKPGLGFRELRGVRIPLPPIEVQRTFVSIINKIRATKKSTQTARERLERLWSGLLHRAFSGDLTAKWREAHMKELLAEMEQQANLLSASC
jgi:type I restriction enzyme S subunit